MIHFAAVGSRGDIQPILLVALEVAKLTRLPCTFVTTPRFHSWIQSCFSSINESVTLRTVDAKIDEILEGPQVAEAIAQGKSMKVMKAFDKETFQKQSSHIINGCLDATVIVTNQMCLYDLLNVKEKCNAKLLLIGYAGIHTSSEMASLLLMSESSRFGFVNKWSGLLAEHFVFNQLNDKSKAIRQELGMAAFKRSIFQKLLADVPCFYAFSPLVQPKCKDWPENAVVGGFITWTNENDKLSDQVEAFLNAGTPPVYLGFGSMPITNTERFKNLVKELPAACPDERFILFLGALDPTDVHMDKQQTNSNQILFVKSTPHHLLFPRCKCIIHHAGAGTTAATLSAGVPSIPCSLFADQPFWAKRLVAIGVSPAAFKFSNFKVLDLKNAIAKCNNDTIKERAKEMAREIAGENGLKRATEWVVGFLKV